METDQAKLLKKIASFLEKFNIPYMITGAWSAIFYGRPRASHDIDFVVELYSKDIERVLRVVDKLSEKKPSIPRGCFKYSIPQQC